jgi:hypothetical protein
MILWIHILYDPLNDPPDELVYPVIVLGYSLDDALGDALWMIL